MENKKRKMFAAIAVIMLCAVAIVGVGYAYTAQTNNSGNTAYSEYVKLSQSGAGAYKFVNGQSVYYNTVNTAEDAYTYSLTNNVVGLNTDGAEGTDYYAVKIGNTFSILTAQVNGTIADLSCDVDFGEGTVGLTAGWNFIFEINNGTTTKYLIYEGGASPAWKNSDKTFTIKANNEKTAYANAVVNVYYGLAGANTSNTAPAAQPLNGVTVEFKATRALENYFTVDFTNDPLAAANLGAIDFNVYLASDTANTTPLTKTTHYVVSWTDNGAAVETPASTAVTAGHTYVLHIAGAGDYNNHNSEFRIVVPAVAP